MLREFICTVMFFWVCRIGVGIGMPLNDFNESQDPEVLHTRRNLAFVVHDALRDRQVTDARKTTYYTFK